MHKWRNAVLNFAVTSIEVGVSPAIDKDKTSSFRTLHVDCGTPVKEPKFCPSCDKKVEAADTVRGIEHPKGSFIPITENEWSSTKPTVKNIVSINKFIESEMLNDMLLADPYWLIPSDRELFASAYAAFKIVLLATGKVGIGTVAFTDKEHPCLLSPKEDGMLLWMLHDPKLIKTPDWELPLPSEQSISMAETLVGLMVKPIESGDFVPPSRKLQAALVESKIAKQPVVPVIQQEANAVPDVLASLKESIALMQKERKSSRSAKPKVSSRSRA